VATNFEGAKATANNVSIKRKVKKNLLQGRQGQPKVHAHKGSIWDGQWLFRGGDQHDGNKIRLGKKECQFCNGKLEKGVREQYSIKSANGGLNFISNQEGGLHLISCDILK